MELIAIGIIAILVVVAETANRRRSSTPQREIMELRARLHEERQFRSDMMQWIEDECGSNPTYRPIKVAVQKKYSERQDQLLFWQAWRNIP
jgi:hypothetical protein